MRRLDQYSKVASSFRIVADSRNVKFVSPTALLVLAQWYFRNRAALRRRVELQANVVRRDRIGFMLIGVLASLGDPHPFRSFTEPVEAFRAVAGETGAALCAEVDSIVARVRAAPHELQVLRTRLASPPIRMRRSKTSPRSFRCRGGRCSACSSGADRRSTKRRRRFSPPPT
jgi:hypothetical protein